MRANRGDTDGVSIGPSARDIKGTHTATRTSGFVFNHNGNPQVLSHLIRDSARDDVGGPAWRKSNYKPYGLVGKSLRHRQNRHKRYRHQEAFHEWTSLHNYVSAILEIKNRSGSVSP